MSVCFGWTDERTETLKYLRKEGMSASQIAKQLGGTSRNAVIGKLHRLGLSGEPRPTRIKSNFFAAPAAPRRVAVPNGGIAVINAVRKVERLARDQAALETHPIPPTPKVATSANPVTIMGLTRLVCRFPINDPPQGHGEDMLFCATVVGEGETYCCEHRQVSTGRLSTDAERTKAAKVFMRNLRRHYS